MTQAPVNPLVVTRWTRYGNDRAYVRLGEAQLGYRDLHTGEIVCDDPAHRASVGTATDEVWRRAQEKRYRPRHADVSTPAPAPPPVTAAAPPPPPAPSVALLPDRDLSTHEPGQAVHARAAALREPAPVRSWVARVLDLKTDERAWRIGGDAERAVAKRLAGLGPEWRVLHSIPVGDRDSDIDHLVVGPAGVFTVNAKHHPDAKVVVDGETVRVDRFRQPYVRNSRHEAGRAAHLLSARAGFEVEVRGIVAVMGAAGGFEVVQQPADGVVVVVKRRRVADHLRSLPAVLDGPTIARVHDVARHLATWQPKRVAWSDAI